jgi:hypothetical protein
MKFIGIFFLLFFGALPAHADCVSDCQASTYCDSSSEYWSCSSRLNSCYAGCRNNNSERRASGVHGAIAYDENSWAYGMADASQDKDSAKKSAMRHCSKYGKKCRVVETFSKTCAAVAEDTKGAVKWAMDDDGRKAAEKALKRCNDKSKNRSCRIRLKHCYYP